MTDNSPFTIHHSPLNNWVETTLGEVCEIKSGSTPSTKEESFWNGEISWITPKDLSNYNSVYISKGEKSITQAGLKNSSAQLLPKNTILFSSRAPIGYVAIAQNELTTNQGFKNLVCDEKKSHFKFFYYLLKEKADHIEKLSSGSTFSEASASLMRSIKILLPPLPEQQAIASVLSAFDDKIELLREQNKTLEEMGQVIFGNWFGKYGVDDDPAKDGASLPEGWRVGKLSEIVDLQGGFVHDTKVSGQAKCKIAKMGVVDGKSWFNRNSIIDYSEEIPEKHKLYEDDLVICTRDVTQDRVVIGNVAIVPKDLADFGLYAGSNTWIIKTHFNKLFLFYFFRSQSFRDHIIQSAKGSTIVMITKDAFLNREIIIPNNEFLENLMNQLNPIIAKVKNGSEQIQSLARSRDELLPKLMSGEVRVSF